MMANKKTETVTETKTVTETATTQSVESAYTIDELADAYKTIGASKVMVKAALKSEGRETYSLTEAKKIVEKFSSKEVEN